MSSAPIPSAEDSSESSNRKESPPARPAEAGVPLAMRGRQGPQPLGRLGRGLVYGTGLFLLRPVHVVACRLIGWKRLVDLRYSNGVLEVERETSVLGLTLGKETEQLPASRLVSVSSRWARAPEPLALGALALAIAVVWGLWQVVDGLYGRSAALVGLGLGAIAAGAAVDLALYWVGRTFPWMQSEGLTLRTRDGREISFWDLPVTSRDRLVTKITEDIKRL